MYWTKAMKSVNYAALSTLAFVVATLCVSVRPTDAEPSLPSSGDFATGVSQCAQSGQIGLNPDLIHTIVGLYASERPIGAPHFKDYSVFFELLPDEESLRFELYRFFKDCVEKAITSFTIKSHFEEVHTCYAEINMTGFPRQTDFVIPTSCPSDAESGTGFKIDDFYVCGSAINAKMSFGTNSSIPQAVRFDMLGPCFQKEDQNLMIKHCKRTDVPSYIPSGSCFIISYKSSK